VNARFLLLAWLRIGESTEKIKAPAEYAEIAEGEEHFRANNLY